MKYLKTPAIPIIVILISFANQLFGAGRELVCLNPKLIESEDRMNLCAKALVAYGGHWHSDFPRSGTTTFASGYLGGHFSNLSLHVKGDYFRLGSDKDETIAEYSRNRTFALKFSRLTEDNFRVVIGKQSPAFGVNQTVFNAYERKFEDEGFRAQPVPLMAVKFDDDRRTVIDFTVSSELERFSSNENLWVRYGYDFYSQGVLRTVISLNWSELGLRRSSLGLVNLQPNGDVNTLEWSHIRTEDGPEAFRQRVRFNHVGHRVGRARWVFQHEFVRKFHALYYLAFDQEVAKNLGFVFGVSYRNPVKGNVEWVNTLVLQAYL